METTTKKCIHKSEALKKAFDRHKINFYESGPKNKGGGGRERQKKN